MPNDPALRFSETISAMKGPLLGMNVGMEKEKLLI
jgi:hypothetical protein